jgi:hypothetical protein
VNELGLNFRTLKESVEDTVKSIERLLEKAWFVCPKRELRWVRFLCDFTSGHIHIYESRVPE